MSRKIGIVLISLAMLIACLSIWPFSLVRKEVKYWTESVKYESYVMQQGETAVLEQAFIAQESDLRQLAFAVGFVGENCEISFELYDENEKQIYARQCVLSQDNNGVFTYIDLDVNVKKGRQYTFCVRVLNTPEAMPTFIYTPEGESTARGNVYMSINGAICDGQAVTSYSYGEPLNYKNVFCIWAVVLTLGLSFIGFLCKGESIIEKRIEALLNKYQIAILVLEILVCTALIVKICFTEAVDWDEAYTWKIVTENSFLGVIEAQAIDNHPPLYFLFAKIATLIFGEQMIVFKAVSVLGSLASMVLCAVWARKRLGGIKVIIPLVLVIGLAPQFLFYNINLRMYSWMVFFVLAAFAAVTEIIYEDKKRYWVLLALAALGGLYTQYFAVIPLFIIYAYLLLECIKNKSYKRFIINCISVVVAYLPQLYLVYRMIVRDNAAKSDEMPAVMKLSEICTWSFQTNIKWSEYLPFVLFIGALVLLVLNWKKLEKTEKGILVLTALMYPLTCFIGYIISNNINHFWHNRYILPSLLFLWIFVICIYAKQNFRTWICFCCWIGITVLSSYVVTKAAEFKLIPDIADTKEKLACVQDEEIILYNFETYDVLYEYYVPNTEFVWIDDVDFSAINGNSIYMIGWGGKGFAPEIVEKYNVHIEYIYPFTLENGISQVYLCKVTFEK